MTMYLTPHRRRHLHRYIPNESIARNIGHIHSDVHVPIDVVDEKDAFAIYATLPGLAADELEIEIVNNTVDIKGEFKNNEVEYLRQERPTGTFRRYLRFSTKLDAAKADAKLNDGILNLRIPKVEEALPKTIKVKTK